MSDFRPADVSTNKEQCTICSKNYTTRRALLQHMRKIHEVEPELKRKASIQCPSCDFKCDRHEKLRYHMQEDHSVEIKVQEERFCSYEEFSTWKESVEKCMNCTYVLKTAAKKLKSEPTKVWYFFCHHSGHYTTKGKNVKLLRSSGSCRMESSCPSSLILKETNSCFSASLYLPHIGHSISGPSSIDTSMEEVDDARVSGSILSNIEIKAKVQDLELFLQKANAVTDQPKVVLKQEDTYFQVPSGRLKLRETEGHFPQLVYYNRPDTEGPKLSRYKQQYFESINEAAGLKEILQTSLGVLGIVKKQRHLFISGQTRIHVDEVESLGNFMELEVVMQKDQDMAEGKSIADELMSVLNISNADLLPCSYIDLLLNKKA